jgi:hypothetical protein
MGLISGTRGCMYNCGEECTGDCLKEQKKKVSPQNPAIDMRTNPEGTNVWKELYDRYDQIHKTMTKDKLEELIFINLGRASMCWSETPTGVFDSNTAVELGREIIKAIEEYIERQEAGWSDPMIEYLDREEKESEWQRKRRLGVMKEAKMNPNPAHYESREITVEDIHKIHKEISDKEREEVPFYYAVDEIVANNDWVGVDENRNPMYRYKGIYYTLDKNFQQILEERVERTPHWWWDALEPRDVPVSSWMDEYKKDYQALVSSGMFWEFHPTWTGEWEKDKFAFCYDKKKKLEIYF